MVTKRGAPRLFAPVRRVGGCEACAAPARPGAPRWGCGAMAALAGSAVRWRRLLGVRSGWGERRAGASAGGSAGGYYGGSRAVDPPRHLPLHSAGAGRGNGNDRPVSKPRSTRIFPGGPPQPHTVRDDISRLPVQISRWDSLVYHGGRGVPAPATSRGHPASGMSRSRGHGPKHLQRLPPPSRCNHNEPCTSW